MRRVTLKQVYDVILSRRDADPNRSYVASLNQKGPDAVLKKVAEECAEVLLAAKNEDRDAAIHELADLWFHCLVWMAQAGIAPKDIEAELGARFGKSGLRPRPRKPPLTPAKP